MSVLTPVDVLPTPGAIGRVVAQDILDQLRTTGRVTVGFPAGRTATPVAVALDRLAHEQQARLDGLSIVMMDEYVTGRPGAWQVLSAAAPHSCIGWGHRNLVSPLSDLGMSADRLVAPDPNAPESFRQAIEAVGGIDIFLLASGQSDGHVALNPPGTARTARTRIVRLDDSTRRDNLSTFPTLRSLADVPTLGITIGTADLADLSRRVVMLLWGRDKARAFDCITRARTYDPAWPATIVHDCHHPVILADAEAAHRSSPVRRSPTEGV